MHRVCPSSSLACVAACAERRVRPAAGPLLLIVFAVVTWYYSLMLVDAYRYPTIDGPTRNYTYIQAVRRYLGAHSWRAPALSSPACHCAALAGRARAEVLWRAGGRLSVHGVLRHCAIRQHVWHGHRVRSLVSLHSTGLQSPFFVLCMHLPTPRASMLGFDDCHKLHTLTTLCALTGTPLQPPSALCTHSPPRP